MGMSSLMVGEILKRRLSLMLSYDFCYCNPYLTPNSTYPITQVLIDFFYLIISNTY